MTYPEAQEIARLLAPFDHTCARWLRTMCQQTGRKATFIIMRYGDPRVWEALPAVRDHRTSKITRPKSLAAAAKIARRVLAANGQAAKALRRRVRAITHIGYKDPAARIVLRDGDPYLWREITHKLKSKKARRELTLARPCVLENVVTGKVIKAPSIVKFCQLAGIPRGSYHISPVLDGHRPHHKGWYLPAFLDQVLHLRDLYSNEHQITVRDWIKSGRSPGSARRLLSGEKRTESHRQIMLASTTNDSQVRPRPNKITQVEVTKNGQTYTGASIKEAGTKAGLKSYHNLYSVAYGFAEEAQGVRIKSIKVEKKRVL